MVLSAIARMSALRCCRLPRMTMLSSFLVAAISCDYTLVLGQGTSVGNYLFAYPPARVDCITGYWPFWVQEDPNPQFRMFSFRTSHPWPSSIKIFYHRTVLHIFLTWWSSDINIWFLCLLFPSTGSITSEASFCIVSSQGKDNKQT